MRQSASVLKTASPIDFNVTCARSLSQNKIRSRGFSGDCAVHHTDQRISIQTALEQIVLSTVLDQVHLLQQIRVVAQDHDRHLGRCAHEQQKCFKPCVAGGSQSIITASTPSFCFNRRVASDTRSTDSIVRLSPAKSDNDVLRRSVRSRSREMRRTRVLIRARLSGDAGGGSSGRRWRRDGFAARGALSSFVCG